MSDNREKKVMAVASGGGHWLQLMRIAPALRKFRIVFVTVNRDYKSSVGEARIHVIKDATRWNKLGQIQQGLQVLFWVLIERPHVIITTGASPGFYALVFGKLVGARTIWIDSIANAEELSMAGRRAARFADLWLTQWSHLAGDEGPNYKGSVL